MSQRRVSHIWHQPVRAALAAGGKVVEAQELIDDASLIDSQDTLLITNFGRVVAAVVPDSEATQQVEAADDAAEEFTVANWDDLSQRTESLQKVAFDGAIVHLHHKDARLIVPVDESFQAGLTDRGDLTTNLLAPETPGSRTS